LGKAGILDSRDILDLKKESVSLSQHWRDIVPEKHEASGTCPKDAESGKLEVSVF